MIGKLDDYNFLAMIPAGLVLGFGLYLIDPHLRTWVLDRIAIPKGVAGDFGGLGLLVFAAFVLGELMHAAARLSERVWWALLRDWPSVKLMKQIWCPLPPPRERSWFARMAQCIYSDQLTELSPTLIKKLQDRIEFEFTRPIAPTGKQYFIVQRQMYVKVFNAKRAQRIDVFNRNYGLYSGLLMSFLILILSAICNRECVPAILSSFCVVICAIGTWTTSYDYAGELILQYADLSDDANSQPIVENIINLER